MLPSKEGPWRAAHSKHTPLSEHKPQNGEVNQEKTHVIRSSEKGMLGEESENADEQDAASVT